MAFLLAVPFALLALAEIVVLIAVGGWIGVGPTLLALIAAAVAGGWLVRRQGLGTLARARASLARNELPVAELFDGLCILIAGALLLAPGFITDAAGLLLFAPPFRAALRRILWRRLEAEAHRRRAPPGAGRVIDGDFVEVDPDRALRDDHSAPDRDGRPGP